MLPQERYKKLKTHLLEENPILVEAIEAYQELDNIAHTLALLPKTKTYTESISWWPLVSVLGTFSAGKSSFINSFLGKKIQQSGNQAVDDKFTVICYAKQDEPTTLPGVALDADPRFPFYNISQEIEKIDSEHNINRYLQLKAVHSPKLKGKILIDSPGFDADTQRDATLRLTEHIIDLSDLILIFFDARHPEPGAMRDTLNHLVEIAKSRSDSDKVLYILNQIDTCATEDNLEEIIGAWQRALAQKGIVSGRFYAIYNEELAKIEDQNQKERLKKRKDQDLKAIEEKIEKVVIDRAYRIVKNIETKAKEIENLLPKLQSALQKFKKRVLFSDIVLILILTALGAYLSFSFPNYTLFIAIALIALFIPLHFQMKKFWRNWGAKRCEEPLKAAFLKKTSWYKPYFFVKIDKTISQKLQSLTQKSKNFIQKLNDQYLSLQRQEANQEVSES